MTTLRDYSTEIYKRETEQQRAQRKLARIEQNATYWERLQKRQAHPYLWEPYHIDEDYVYVSDPASLDQYGMRFRLCGGGLAKSWRLVLPDEELSDTEVTDPESLGKALDQADVVRSRMERVAKNLADSELVVYEDNNLARIAIALESIARSLEAQS